MAAGGLKKNGFGSMGTTKAAGSEVANVEHLQPAGGRADSRHWNTEARIMYCLGTAVTSVDKTQMLAQVEECGYLSR